MSGSFLLDTNAVIQLLKGNESVFRIIENADFIACSIISELEYLSFSDISEKDISLLSEFLSRISIIDLASDDLDLKSHVVKLRQSKKVKLPDAIIVASAKLHDCKLVTADKALIRLRDYVDIIEFSPTI